jgi:hypothetical protein
LLILRSKKDIFDLFCYTIITYLFLKINIFCIILYKKRRYLRAFLVAF